MIPIPTIAIFKAAGAVTVVHTTPIDQLAFSSLLDIVVEVCARHKVDAIEALRRTVLVIRPGFSWQTDRFAHTWSRTTTHEPFWSDRPYYRVEARSMPAALEAITDLLWATTSLRDLMARNELYVDVQSVALGREEAANRPVPKPIVHPAFAQPQIPMPPQGAP